MVQNKIQCTTRLVAESIRTLRVSHRMTQRQLAERCNISASAICKIENCDQLPDSGQLSDIAHALGTTVGALYHEIHTSESPNRTDNYYDILDLIHSDIIYIKLLLEDNKRFESELSPYLKRMIEYYKIGTS